MLRTVRVGGRLLVENGRHVKNDALAGGYRQVLEKLRS
jgi:hypothetical protein